METMEPTPPPVPPQPVPPPPKPRRLPHVLAGLTIFILGLTAGAFGTRFLNQPPPLSRLNPVISPSLSPTPTPDPTTDWKTYQSLVATFKYPSDWKIDTNRKRITSMNLINTLFIFGKDDPMMNECMEEKNRKTVNNLLVKYFSHIQGTEACSNRDAWDQREIWIVKADGDGFQPGIIYQYSSDRLSESEAIFDLILSTFKFIESVQKADDAVSDSQIRNIAFAPQIDVNNGGTWRSYSSNTGFSIQYPTYFRISGPEKFSGLKCSVYFINDVGGFISASVVPYAGGSRRELYGIRPGYDYRFEDVIIQKRYKSLIIEAGPAGDSGSGTGIVIPVGKNALILTWTNISKDIPAFNELLGSIKIDGSLNINSCGT